MRRNHQRSAGPHELQSHNEGAGLIGKLNTADVALGTLFHVQLMLETPNAVPERPVGGVGAVTVDVTALKPVKISFPFQARNRTE